MNMHLSRRSASLRRASRAGIAALLAVMAGACADDDASNTDTATATADGESGEVDQEQLEAIAAMFPIDVTISLTDFDVVGGYTMTLSEAYCDGLPTCGTSPAPMRADIVNGANGLELQVPGVLSAGLFGLNGSLFSVVDSDGIIAPCGDVARTARVSVTLFGNAVTLQNDGTSQLTGLAGSLLVEGHLVEGCEAGVVFYEAQLVPG